MRADDLNEERNCHFRCKLVCYCVVVVVWCVYLYNRESLYRLKEDDVCVSHRVSCSFTEDGDCVWLVFCFAATELTIEKIFLLLIATLGDCLHLGSKCRALVIVESSRILTVRALVFKTNSLADGH